MLSTTFNDASFIKEADSARWPPNPAALTRVLTKCCFGSPFKRSASPSGFDCYYRANPKSSGIVWLLRVPEIHVRD